MRIPICAWLASPTPLILILGQCFVESAGVGRHKGPAAMFKVKESLRARAAVRPAVIKSAASAASLEGFQAVIKSAASAASLAAQKIGKK